MASKNNWIAVFNKLLFSCSLCCLLGNQAQIIEHNLLFDKDIVRYFEGLQELGLCFLSMFPAHFP